MTETTKQDYCGQCLNDGTICEGYRMETTTMRCISCGHGASQHVFKKNNQVPPAEPTLIKSEDVPINTEPPKENDIKPKKKRRCVIV